MKDWKRIRVERLDLTDYVIHLTRSGDYKPGHKIMSGRERLLKILDDGCIQATFAPRKNQYQLLHDKPNPTVRGPHPAVCFTDQPIWALIKSLEVFQSRYLGYGIAFHKAPLFQRGGRPVFYSDDSHLADLPESLKHFFVTYAPDTDPTGYPVDFTWEREWRIRPRDRWRSSDELELDVDHSAFPDAAGTIVVRKDKDAPVIKEKLEECKERAKDATEWRDKWPFRLTRVLSLETAARLMDDDQRYCRIDTWPWDESP